MLHPEDVKKTVGDPVRLAFFIELATWEPTRVKTLIHEEDDGSGCPVFRRNRWRSDMEVLQTAGLITYVTAPWPEKPEVLSVTWSLTPLGRWAIRLLHAPRWPLPSPVDGQRDCCFLTLEDLTLHFEVLADLVEAVGGKPFLFTVAGGPPLVLMPAEQLPSVGKTSI